MTFDLPMPPTANSMFATDFKTKRRFTSKAYAAWKLAAGEALGSQYAAYGSPPIHKPVALHIRLGINYQSDIANREKAITDLLVATLDMPDDRYIDQLLIERSPGVVGAVVTIGVPTDYGKDTRDRDVRVLRGEETPEKPGDFPSSASVQVAANASAGA